MDIGLIAFILRLVGVILLGVGLIVGAISDRRDFRLRQQHFAEHQKRIDEMIGGR